MGRLACRETRRRGGFTLLELILALGLTMLLVSTSLVFFQQVLRMREAVSGELARQAVVRTVLDRLTLELQTAHYDAERQQGLAGSSTQLAVVTTALPEPAAWVDDDERVRRPVSSDVRRVGYELAGSQLRRSEQRQLLGGGQQRSADVAVLSDEIRFVRFRYWDGQGWQASWADGPLPVAVEVWLGRDPLPDEAEAEDYPHPYHRRVIALSAADADAARAAAPAAGDESTDDEPVDEEADAAWDGWDEADEPESPSGPDEPGMEPMP